MTTNYLAQMQDAEVKVFKGRQALCQQLGEAGVPFYETHDSFVVDVISEEQEVFVKDLFKKCFSDFMPKVGL